MEITSKRFPFKGAMQTAQSQRKVNDISCADGRARHQILTCYDAVGTDRSKHVKCKKCQIALLNKLKKAVVNAGKVLFNINYNEQGVTGD